MNHNVVQAVRELSVQIIKNEETGKQMTVATRPLAWPANTDDIVLKTVWPLIEVLERCLDDKESECANGGKFDSGIPWLEIYTLFKNDDDVFKHAKKMVKRGTVITEQGFCYYWVYRDEMIDGTHVRTGIWIDDVHESGWGTTMVSFKQIVVAADVPHALAFSPLTLHPINFPEIHECNIPDYDVTEIPARSIISLKGTRPAERASIRIGEVEKGRLNQIYGYVECAMLPMWMQQAIFSGETVMLRVFETTVGKVFIPVQLHNVHVWDRFSNLEV